MSFGLLTWKAINSAPERQKMYLRSERPSQLRLESEMVRHNRHNRRLSGTRVWKGPEMKNLSRCDSFGVSRILNGTHALKDGCSHFFRPAMPTTFRGR